MHQTEPDHQSKLVQVRKAAQDREPIGGLTHTFYRYPARFSPTFARAAIVAFSEPGDTVLDPYMGGGTTVVEALALGRRAIGADINSLACFVARVKVTPLDSHEREAVQGWANCTVQSIRYSQQLNESDDPRLTRVPRNLTLADVRPLRKTIALCIAAAERDLPTQASRDFARCVMLNVGQWALNGRRRIPRADELRNRVGTTCSEMLDGLGEMLAARQKHEDVHWPVLVETDAEHLHEVNSVAECGPADLVVTSPPYPGIHMLYHRWQVDGRKETDAPYWIAACSDGAGSSFYNFADRRREAEDRYFEKAESTFRATRGVTRDGAVVVQLIAFADPERQLRRYLTMMERAGFRELREKHARRIWREVPGRRWHANSKGKLPSSREVLLLHEAL